MGKTTLGSLAGLGPGRQRAEQPFQKEAEAQRTPGFPAGGCHCQGHSGHGTEYRHYPVYRGTDPGLHGSGHLGYNLQNTAVDALLYKNWFWWGLDLIADGLVLIFVAGTWYLLATMITGKKLFMQNIARAALLVELVVSWTVWSHHLLSDQAQPGILKVVSGEMVTAFELITQGLAFFITLATLWAARPLKMTNELKFLLGGLLGFALAVPAGIMQADVGLNRILHNTQWMVGPHVHVAVLVGLTMTLYSAIYILFPILTNGAKLYSQKLANIHFWCHLIGGIGMGAFMGMAGLKGMLQANLVFRWRIQYSNDPGPGLREPSC